MSSKSMEQMYLEHKGKRFRFPVLPEEVTVKYGKSNDTMRVCGIGEVTIIQDKNATEISFSSFFPKHYFSGCNYKDIPTPKSASKFMKKVAHSKKPALLVVTGTRGFSMYVTVNEYVPTEQGGDLDTVYYSVKMKEYQEAKIRKLAIKKKKKKAKIRKPSGRTDPSDKKEGTYTVVKGDCLWNIAKKFYGEGSKYTIIYNANKSVIGGNPNLIYPGQKLTIPEDK